MFDAITKERLKHLTQFRQKYFMLPKIQKQIFKAQFEETQKEILRIKLTHDIYFDELDLLIIRLNYHDNDKFYIMYDAEAKNQVKWIRKKYNPMHLTAEYIGQVKNELTDLWLIKTFFIQCFERVVFNKLKLQGTKD